METEEEKGTKSLQSEDSQETRGTEGVWEDVPLGSTALLMPWCQTSNLQDQEDTFLWFSATTFGSPQTNTDGVPGGSFQFSSVSLHLIFKMGTVMIIISQERQED